MNKTKAIFLCILLLLAATSVIRGDDSTRDNEFGLKDKSYYYYTQGLGHSTERTSILYADSLRRYALASGDDRGYVMSYLLPVYYYSNFNNYNNVKMAADTLRSVAKIYSMPRYYYQAYMLEVSHLCRFMRYRLALRVARQCSNEANQAGDKYGIYTSYRIMGDIYASQKLSQEALKSYRMAIDYLDSNLPEEDATDIYINIFDAESRPEAKAEILQQAFYKAKDPIVRYRMKIRQLLYDGSTRNAIQFSSHYRELMSDTVKYVSPHLPDVNAYGAMFDNRPADAYAFAMQAGRRDDRLRLVSEIASYFGDYYKAYDAQRQLNAYNDSLQSSRYLVITASYAEQMENDELKNDLRIKAMEAQEKTLMLQKASAEADLLRARQEVLEARDAKFVSERERAKAENLRNLTLLKRSQSERSLSRLRLDQMVMKSTIYLLSIFVTLLCVIIVVSVVYNINRRKMVEKLHESNEKLRLAQARCEEANQMKNLFVQNMNHEIRTPLNAVIGFSQLLSTPGIPLTPEERAEYAGYIDTNGKMLTMLVDDVLNVADIESNSMKLKYSIANVREICNNAEAMVKHRVPIGVELLYSSDLPDDYTIYTDVGRVQQVLVNYLTNACKNTTEGSITLHVTDKANPGNITFSVTDTGIGIPKEEREAIFERFKKLDSFKQGAGIGLNICLSIANLLNGMAWCDPEYDGGSRFYFELPLETT